MGWGRSIGWSVTYIVIRNTSSPNLLTINHLQNMVHTVSTPSSTPPNPEPRLNPNWVWCLGRIGPWFSFWTQLENGERVRR